MSFRAISVVLLVGILFLPKLVWAENKSFENLFYIVDGKNGLTSLREHVEAIDIIAPQSYTLSSNLKISGSVNRQKAITKLYKD